MWFPDCSVIAFERRVVGIREKLPGVDSLGRVRGACHGAFYGSKKNCPWSNKICRFCLLANNFNFIFAQINNSLKL